MRFLLRQRVIYRLKNVQKSNYTHGGNTGDVFARTPPFEQKKSGPPPIIFQKMKGCTIIWLQFAFVNFYLFS